jgi:hypothetical protein
VSLKHHKNCRAVGAHEGEGEVEGNPGEDPEVSLKHHKNCRAVGAHEGEGEVEGNPGEYLEVSLKHPKPPSKVKLLKHRLRTILQLIP